MERPILFNTDMVKAILDGRKTQTRRIVKIKRSTIYKLACAAGKWLENFTDIPNEIINWYVKEKSKPPCQVGDTLWVRETWGNWTNEYPESNAVYYQYKADYPDGAKTYMFDSEHECDLPKWHPSIHMPRAAARILLKVTDVRAERLQNITIDGIEQEGIPLTFPLVKLIDSEHLKKFINLWDSTIDMKNHWMDYSWGANPWVWVIEFERMV